MIAKHDGMYYVACDAENVAIEWAYGAGGARQPQSH